MSSCALLSPTYYYLSPHTRSLIRRPSFSIFITRPHSSLGPSNPKPVRVFNKTLDLSWIECPDDPKSCFHGWDAPEPPPLQKPKKGSSALVIGGIGVSLAFALAVLAHLSFKRGFKFRIPGSIHAWRGFLTQSQVGVDSGKSVDSDLSEGNEIGSEESARIVPVAVTKTGTSDNSASWVKVERVIIPSAVDFTQKEALAVLKRLKIIEDDVKGEELCTRREYVRWLVQINTLLERNPKRRVVPSVTLSGTIIAAFDDMSVEDPDFSAIQALAEAGVIPSKLLERNQGDVLFFPEKYISRQDLINWRAQLEYGFSPAIEEQISRTKLGFMDLKKVNSDLSPEFFMDMLADDNSISRRVFGQSKRFQPNKPSTNGQAAVALTAGWMMEAIQTELSRLEAENSLRMAEMEEIRSELLERGEIQKSWDEKLKREESRALEIEKIYVAEIHELEQENLTQEKHFQEQTKEKAALDCQRQLILTLTQEVDEMSERLASERALYEAEKCNMEDSIKDLQTKQEGVLDAKSILEAEKEATRILRSWVEDEARKNQARANVLEEVGRRWRWNNQG